MRQLSEEKYPCGQQDKVGGFRTAGSAGRRRTGPAPAESRGAWWGRGAPVTDLGLIAVDPSLASLLLVQLIRRCLAKC